MSLITEQPANYLRVSESKSGAVEEDALVKFAIGLADVKGGAIASGSIDITSISVSLEKSTGGGVFSSAGITQPTFGKDTGIVFDEYQFLLAEWANGDMYQLTVSGITATIDSDTAYVKTVVWSNMIIEAGNVEAKIDAIQTDLGDPSARTNLQNIEDMLGNPDTASKSIYEAVKNIRETAIDGSSIPLTNSLSDTLHKDGSYTYDNTTDSLEASRDNIDTLIGTPVADVSTDVAAVKTVVDANQDLLDGTTATPTAYKREAGVNQVIEVSITANANAGVTTVATATTQPVLVKRCIIHADAAQTADMTSCALEGGDSQVVEFISAATAVQASLDAADKQVYSNDPARLAATKAITIDLQGTGATPVDLTVTIEYESCVDGGYLV